MDVDVSWVARLRRGPRPRLRQEAVLPWSVALVAAVALGAICIRRVLAAAGEPALPLDDSFIHLQYARRLAEGGFFSYMPGEGYSSGATSWAWPALLAPFWALGLRDLSLVWVSWGLGILALGATMVETARLAAGLCGSEGGRMAGVMCVAFGAYAWFAMSGMETLALAWVLTRTARVAAELCEAPIVRGSARAQLAVLGLVAPLVRPEGAIASVMAAIGQLAARSGPSGARLSLGRRLAWALLALLGPLVIPLTNLALVGHAASATARSKWLGFDPYLDPATLLATVAQQARFLVGDLLQANAWTTIFLPDGTGTVVLLGLGAVTVAGVAPHWVDPEALARRRLGFERGRTGSRLWRAAFVWLVALGTLVPASYGTMLWNRVRYLWPFAPSWFVAASCLGMLVATLASRLAPALALVGPALLGAAIALLAEKLPWAVADLAQSARAIAHQQVALARWAAVLPPDARIGVNDTGAIAYLSGRRTFDVVGLTTESETRYWLAGAGSRFEHYERLGASRLPTHFFVYPEWMNCPPVLGRELHRETVLEQSILGGSTMIAYEAHTELLGSGAMPFALGRWGPLRDELDVADLDSEQEHGYVLLPARSADNVVASWPTVEGRVVADGGRGYRVEDRFVSAVPAGEPTTLVIRSSGAPELEIWIDGALGARTNGPAAQGVAWWGEDLPIPAGAEQASGRPTERWVERVVELPAPASGRQAVVVRGVDGKSFASFHYWWFGAELGHHRAR